MTKIIDLPTTASTDANTFVPVYKNGKTQKVSATVFGGGGSGLDLTSTTDVPTVEGTEYLPLNKPLGTVFRVTVQRILDWILARANTWTANQTFNANVNFTGNVGIGTSAPANKFVVSEAGAQGLEILPNTAGAAWISSFNRATGSSAPLILLSSALVFNAPSAHFSGVFGYGVGAGGTVVQATGKSETLALNKPSGTITMHNAPLNAGRSVSLGFANSTIGFQDIVEVQIVGGAAARGSYEVWADQSGYGAGSISIFVKNISPGSLSESLVLSFAVKKVATS